MATTTATEVRALLEREGGVLIHEATGPGFRVETWWLPYTLPGPGGVSYPKGAETMLVEWIAMDHPVGWSLYGEITASRPDRTIEKDIPGWVALVKERRHLVEVLRASPQGEGEVVP